MKKIILLLALVTGFAWAETPIVEQQEVMAQIKQPQANVVILDVRSAEEFAESHIPGAINLDYQTLGDNLAQLAAHIDDKIIVHCRSGRRAGIAEQLLINNGFKQVYHLKGDMLAWQAANLPVEK